MAELNIQKRRAGDVTILDLQGDITIGTSGVIINDAIKGLVEQGKNKVLLNLAKVNFVDSSGLGNLIASFNTVRGAGGEIKLLNLTKRVRDIMVITKLVTVFDVFDQELDALKSYN